MKPNSEQPKRDEERMYADAEEKQRRAAQQLKLVEEQRIHSC